MVEADKKNKLHLSDLLEEMFMVLTDKERDVVRQRFSLDNKPKRTLEYIGRQFSVTRERIRQVEKIALGKLKRTVQTSKLSMLNELAESVLDENGGVLVEDVLVANILNKIGSKEDVEGSIVRLALNINPSLIKQDKTNVYKTFWRMSEVSLPLINVLIKSAFKILTKKGDVLSSAKLITAIRRELGDSIEGATDPMILSVFAIDKRLKFIDEAYGLMTWRHINPKSIRDKAYIVLKKIKTPLHFIEIANKISEAGFDKKVVTTQAVHNELIRYEQFILVGRGLYSLKEFGYKSGTVADVIEDLLSENGSMTKQEIIDGVLKRRYVKKGTISLNLQKVPHFVRVGRAVYKLDKKQK